MILGHANEKLKVHNAFPCTGISTVDAETETYHKVRCFETAETTTSDVKLQKAFHREKHWKTLFKESQTSRNRHP